MNGVDALAQAIAQNEGWNVNGSLPQRLNNPGDLMSGGSLESFPNPQSGWDALTSKLNNISNGNSKTYPLNETLSDFANTYTGGDPNAANNIASSLGGGFSPSSLLSSILHSTSPVAGAMMDAASSTTGSTVASAGSWLADLFGNSDSIVLRISTIIVGLIFIAGAIFSFESVKTTIVETAKGAAKAAEVS